MTQWDGMLRSGAYALVLEEAERQHGQGGEASPEAALRIAVRACQAAACMRAWGRAVTWADRGLSLQSGSRDDLILLHFLAGTALMYTGDLLRAGRELQLFRREAVGHPHLERLLGDAYYNEAYVMRATGRTADEVKLFTEAAGVYERHEKRDRVVVCSYEIGWSLLLAGRPDEAEAHLKTAEQGLAGHADPELPVDLQLAWALYWHLAGDWYQSEHICRELASGPRLPGRQEADLLWIMGRNALDRGDRRAATTYLSRAAEAAAEVWWPPQTERISSCQAAVAAGTVLHR